MAIELHTTKKLEGEELHKKAKCRTIGELCKTLVNIVFVVLFVVLAVFVETR